MKEPYYREQIKQQVRQYESWDKDHQEEVNWWKRYEQDFDDYLPVSRKVHVHNTNQKKRTAAHIYLSIKANSFMAMVDTGVVISVIAEKLAQKLGLKIENE